MAYATSQQAKDFYAGQNALTIRLTAVMSTAAGEVARLAPPPAPMDATYPDRARDAELLIGEYLWETKGWMTSVSISGIGLGYMNYDAIKGVVKSTMGEYYTGGSSVAYLEKVPW